MRIMKKIRAFIIAAVLSMGALFIATPSAEPVQALANCTLNAGTTRASASCQTGTGQVQVRGLCRTGWGAYEWRSGRWADRYELSVIYCNTQWGFTSGNTSYYLRW